MENGGKKTHFVLIHGAAVGAWSWYRVTDLLLKAGHEVTALDMGASGKHPKQADDIKNLKQFSEPLLQFMETLAEKEQVVLVGHSSGGFNISLAMETFPTKVSAAIFVAAFMPNSGSSFPDVLQEVGKRLKNDWQDSVFEFSEEPKEGKPFQEVLKSFMFGDSLIKSRIAQRSPSTDLILTSCLGRKCPFFKDRLILTEEKYGTVKRMFVMLKNDKIFTPDHQRQMIEENPPDKVYEIEESDHCVFFSCPEELVHVLTEISHEI